MGEGERICIVGLGYVGLPLAVLFARRYTVIGCDTNPDRIRELRQGRDATQEVSAEELNAVAGRLSFAADMAAAHDCNVYVITVPTPIDPDHQPDLSMLESACRDVGGVLKQGDLVVIESTVYPGVTEEICVPILEKESGLQFNADFTCGYSPERLSPGTAFRHIADIIKVTAGSTPAAADRTDALYKSVISAGTFRAQSIRTAEAAKILENVQRDVNIALMNETAMIFSALHLDTHAVLEAAATKWNFLNFQPGLAGGHCIGVDPYYLIHKARACGYDPTLIPAARNINDSMGAYIAEQTLSLLKQRGRKVEESRVLILGFTFKENCPDPRNSRVWDIFRRLRDAGSRVEACDPIADAQSVQAEYGIALEIDTDAALKRNPDAVIYAVAHDAFRHIPVDALGKALVMDIKGIAPRWDWRL